MSTKSVQAADFMVESSADVLHLLITGEDGTEIELNVPLAMADLITTQLQNGARAARAIQMSAPDAPRTRTLLVRDTLAQRARAVGAQVLAIFDPETADEVVFALPPSRAKALASELLAACAALELH